MSYKLKLSLFIRLWVQINTSVQEGRYLAKNFIVYINFGFLVINKPLIMYINYYFLTSSKLPKIKYQYITIGILCNCHSLYITINIIITILSPTLLVTLWALTMFCIINVLIYVINILGNKFCSWCVYAIMTWTKRKWWIHFSCLSSGTRKQEIDDSRISYIVGKHT